MSNGTKDLHEILRSSSRDRTLNPAIVSLTKLWYPLIKRSAVDLVETDDWS
jgi:hypothetical protein